MQSIKEIEKIKSYFIIVGKLCDFSNKLNQNTLKVHENVIQYKKQKEERKEKDI